MNRAHAILVINCGSSSIKFRLLDGATGRTFYSGLVERIGQQDCRLIHRQYSVSGSDPVELTTEPAPTLDHQQGMKLIADLISACLAREPDTGGIDLVAVGHRVVHGGELFHQPVLISSDVIVRLKSISQLAPLHLPANLAGIEFFPGYWPNVPQVAVFDTAFHHSMPDYAYHYPVPRSWYDTYGVRRYGFHGTSHHYVAKQAAAYLQRKLDTLNLITLHLGNGASAAAIRHGQSIDTSMGMTPLEGLMMGTRCGDIDPALPAYLADMMGKNSHEILAMLNKQSGLHGVCGTNDMRTVQQMAAAGDTQAVLALHMFCYRIKKYIGAYMAVLGHADAIIFTGGIGEHDADVRGRVCAGLETFGIRVDQRHNQSSATGIVEFQTNGAAVKLLVVPTDEELEIAQQTMASLQQAQADMPLA